MFLNFVFSQDEYFKLSDFLPEKSAQRINTVHLAQKDSCLEKLKVVFLATPAEASLKLAPEFLQKGISVIDLSGAFRLHGAKAYEKWYGFNHNQEEALAKAHYGLIPWAEPIQNNKQSVLIANPGCYSTSILMALLPLLKSNIVDTDSLVIDAKSGTTGAGRQAKENSDASNRRKLHGHHA